MRSAVLIALLASGCTPEVVAGAYYCGPEQSCPEDQACDGITNICVAQSSAQDFACGAGETEPNNSIATAQSVGNIECTSLIEGTGCVRAETDDQDYFSFMVPGTCGPRSVRVRASFPVAFEPIVLELVDSGGAVLASSESCETGISNDVGSANACLEADIAAGEVYAVRATGAGSENCDGACAYNRYGYLIQLSPQ